MNKEQFIQEIKNSTTASCNVCVFEVSESELSEHTKSQGDLRALNRVENSSKLRGMNPIQSIKKFFQSTTSTKAVVGLSGGVDSALTCILLVKALGAENVTALLLPEQGISSGHSITDAKALAKQLGINYFTIPINTHLKDFEKLPWTQSRRAHLNNKARMRMMILYNFANTHNCLVAGTSNKTEILLGYGTKHGDGAADVYIIGELLKKEVYVMAKELGVPESILSKPPSAELFAGQTDEEELGMSYADIDAVLEELHVGYGALVKKHGKELVDNIFKRISENKHKGNTKTINKI